jgi:hypothetical protein
MKWAIAVICILVLTPRASGQATSTYNTGIGHATPMIPTEQAELPNTLMGVVIESWHYDAGQKTLTLHLVNHSHKVVTAFNISFAEKYADGTTNPWHAEGIPHNLRDSQRMEDELNLFIQSQDERRRGHGIAVSGPVVNGQIRMPGPPTSVFAAGTTRDYVLMRGEEKDVADIEAVVDVVAYADGTADVQNDRAFRNLMAERKGPLLAMQKVVEVIKGVLADPMVSSPIAEVLRALKPLADAGQTKNRPPEDPEFFQAMTLRDELKNLETMQQRVPNEREWLTLYSEQQEKRIALMTPHADLHVDLPELR